MGSIWHIGQHIFIPAVISPLCIFWKSLPLLVVDDTWDNTFYWLKCYHTFWVICKGFSLWYIYATWFDATFMVALLFLRLIWLWMWHYICFPLTTKRGFHPMVSTWHMAWYIFILAFISPILGFLGGVTPMGSICHVSQHILMPTVLSTLLNFFCKGLPLWDVASIRDKHC